MLRVWGRKTSSNVQSVMWCTAELGLDVERYDVGHAFGGTDTPDFLAMNPNGLVPVLRDGDGPPMWESAAILRYLANRYAEPPFWPNELEARAQIDKWAEWSKINVAATFTAIFVQVVRTPVEKRDQAAVDHASTVLARHLALADAELARHAFLAGDHMTLADIQLGSVLFRYYDVAIAPPNLIHLRRYYDDLQNRPAYREHVMIDYGSLRAA